MSDEVENIIIGVVSGVISSFFIWLLVVVFNGVFMPWLRGVIYRGVNINGNWTTEVKREDCVTDYNLMIEQAGFEIKGIFSINYKEKDRISLGCYNISGTISDGVVALLVDNRDKSTCGTIILKVATGGGSMTGLFAYKGVSCETITSENLVLNKS
jgi:hypothetical protein